VTPFERAGELRRRYGISHLERVDDDSLEAVCAGERLDVEAADFAGDVLEVYAAPAGRLGLRRGLARPLRRWLTGHGLGHHLLHRGSGFSSDAAAVAQRERAAELFAGWFFLGLGWSARQAWELAELHAVPQDRVERFIGLECGEGAVSARWQA
jgi:hypothetical protein